MSNVVALLCDTIIFVVLPWLLWRATRRVIPIAVIPILIGIFLAVLHVPMEDIGIPSVYGNKIGWLGVLFLAFNAGLEMHQESQHKDQDSSMGSSPLPRLIGGAIVAVIVPFLIGTALVYTFFLPLQGWRPAHAFNAVAAASIGLCIAVSALPVLLGIVRELHPQHQPIGQLALKIAIVDDVMLWIGLAVLQCISHGVFMPQDLLGNQSTAILLLIALAAGGRWGTRHLRSPPQWLIWVILCAYLFAGSWASSQLGLHELIGAYLAGAMMPVAWVRRLPLERLSQLSFIVLAPLFFGHGGLKIDGDALTWPSILASLALVAIAITTKIGSLFIYPPASNLRPRQILSIGALLQCKGLMEIVAATILHTQGLLSEIAFASLMILAVISTTLTGPLFKLVAKTESH